MAWDFSKKMVEPSQPDKPQPLLVLYPDGEMSPLLRPLKAEVAHTAPLLPPPPPPSTPAGFTSEALFCTEGPELGGCGQARRSNSKEGSTMTLPQLVARVKGVVNQASLLINERLATLRRRCSGTLMSAEHRQELCEIAGGIDAAAYRVQKWAFALQGDSGELRKPVRPATCQTLDEAYAVFHAALPRLMINAAKAFKGLTAAVKAHGDEAEAELQSVGISSEDLRSLAPHLESLVHRLGRLLLRVP